MHPLDRNTARPPCTVFAKERKAQSNLRVLQRPGTAEHVAPRHGKKRRRHRRCSPSPQPTLQKFLRYGQRDALPRSRFLANAEQSQRTRAGIA